MATTNKTKLKTKTPAFLAVKPHDYIVGDDSKKKWLMQVTSVNDGIVYGNLEANRAYNPQQGEFRIDQVIAILGPKPALGSTYGVAVEPFIRTLVHSEWGDVHFFVDLKPEMKTQLKGALDEVAKKLKAKRLFSFVKHGNMAMEIRQPKGKWDGMYAFKHEKTEPADRMMLRPKGVNQMNYVLAHESGHGVWYRLMTKKMHSRWIKLYKSYTKAQEFSAADIRRLRDDYIKDSVHVKDYRGQLEEDHAILFDNLIGQLTSNSRLTVKHLDVLSETGDLEVIKDAWPMHAEDSDFDVAITEYGTTSVEELFAEAFAFWLLGNKIPQIILALMEKTVAHCKTVPA